MSITINKKVMANKIINQRQAIKMLKLAQDISSYEVEFNEQKVEAREAILLGKNKIKVPEGLIYYDDKTIDFSNDPDITDQDITDGKIKWIVKAEIPLENEITAWIKKENININDFAAQLIRNFYQGIQSLPKNNNIEII
jgi:hypothetical protein